MSSAGQVKVSVGRGVSFQNPFIESLATIYKATRQGFIVDPDGIFHDIKEPIERLRLALENGNEMEAKRIKRGLMACTLSGSFPGGNRKKSDITHSGRMQVDIDDLDYEIARCTRDKLQRDPHIEFASISPSNNGVKASILIPPCQKEDQHKAFFLMVKKYFEESYEIKIDPSTKDLPRLMFLPYDKEAYISENPPLELDIARLKQQKISFPVSSNRTNKSLQQNFDTAEKNLQKACQEISKAVDGNRHKTRLNRARYIGSLIHHGLLDENKAKLCLLEAARSNTSDKKAAELTICNGLIYGKANPIDLPDIEKRKNDPQPDTPENTQETTHSFYKFNESGTWRWKNTKEGQTLLPLANFTARIVEQLEFDDGEQTKLYFRIEAQSGDRCFPEVIVANQKFSSLGFVSEHYGAHAQIHPPLSNKDYLRHAIQVNSSQILNTRVFTHTGLREVDGQLTYLSSSGALDLENVQVQLDEGHRQKLKRYELPVSSTPEEVKEGIEASLSFLDVASRSVSLPLWMAPYAAAIVSEIEEHFMSLYLLGPTGSRKTSLAVLSLCHHGNFSTDNLYTFNDTTNSLEKVSFVLKDAPMLVDDFYPTTNRKDQQRMISTFESLTRSAGNRSGRGRMMENLRLRDTFYPRGMVWFTGEDLIGAGSALARLNLVEIEPNSVDLKMLSALQQRSYLLPHALTDFLRWWRDNRDQARSKFAVKTDEELIYNQFGNFFHGRLIRQISLWQRMMAVLCDWLIDRQVCSEEKVEDLLQSAGTVFIDNAKLLQRRIQNTTPTKQFVDIILALHASDKLWIKDWIHFSEDKPVGKEFLGWRKEQFIYAQSKNLWHLIQEYCQREGSAFPVRQNTLWTHLAREGVLEKQNGNISQSTKIPAESYESRRVMKLRYERIFNAEVQ